MRRVWLVASLVATVLAVSALSTRTQLAAQGVGDELVNLFFDCQAPGCHDFDYFRREVPFVNWVRDREVADLHVLVTSQGTGGGGTRYTLAFLGIGAFQGSDHEMTYATSGDATTDAWSSSGVSQASYALPSDRSCST